MSSTLTRRGVAVRPLSVMTVALLSVLLVAGCGKSKSASGGPTATSSGSCPTTETVQLAKSKFAAHAGLAAGAFYEFIFRPYKAGSLKLSVSNAAPLAKAALAGVFAVHEIDVAENDAEGDPTLCRAVVAPLDAVKNAFNGIVDKVKSGGADEANIATVDSSFASLKQTAASSGAAIENQVPGIDQLSHPPTGNGT